MNFNIGEDMPQSRSLRALKVGERACITSIAAEGELGRRIRDMGLVPGAEVEVVGRAPLKDPVALRLKGFTLSLRNNEADNIFVSTPEV
jgi:ferrous iron transport protein A